MTSEVTTPGTDSAAVLEKVVVEGDLSKLSPAERMTYYRSVCESLGLNPITRPFEYATLQNKLVLYARKDCAEQLRTLRGISCRIVDRMKVDDVYIVTARATDRTGREDESTGAVAVSGMKGNDLANAMMKAETKAKRRVTLSIAGLGIVDESELETIRDARTFTETDLARDSGGSPRAYTPSERLDEMQRVNTSMQAELERKGMIPPAEGGVIDVTPEGGQSFGMVPSMEELLAIAGRKGVFLKKLALDELGKDRFDQFTEQDRMILYDLMMQGSDKPPAGKR